MQEDCTGCSRRCGSSLSLANSIKKEPCPVCNPALCIRLCVGLEHGEITVAMAEMRCIVTAQVRALCFFFKSLNMHSVDRELSVWQWSKL